MSGTAPLAGRNVGVFALLEAVFKLFDSFVLLGVAGEETRSQREERDPAEEGSIDPQNGSPRSNDLAIRQAWKARLAAVRLALP